MSGSSRAPARALLFHQRVHQGLERGLRLLDQLRIARARLDEAAEHHPVMRRMRDGELHVGVAHRLEAGPAAAFPFPRLDERQPQRAEALARDRGDQRLLVGEVAVEGRARHAERLADGAQREPLDARPVDRAQRLIDQGAAEVAVVVLTGSLLPRPPHRGTDHRRSS